MGTFCAASELLIVVVSTADTRLPTFRIRSDRDVDADTFAAMTPAQRTAAMRKLCPSGSCDRTRVWRVVAAAGSEKEKASLNRLAESLILRDQARFEADERQADASGRISVEEFNRRVRELISTCEARCQFSSSCYESCIDGK